MEKEPRCYQEVFIPMILTVVILISDDEWDVGKGKTVTRPTQHL